MDEEPIRWRVSAIRVSERAVGRLERPEPEITDYPDKGSADAYKAVLKAQGMMATVTPVFIRPQQRGKIRKAGQARTAEKGFNRDWRLHDGTQR